MTVCVHKHNDIETPLVSLVLLDWSVREHFHALDWLSQQNVPRGQYEIIWIELYERVVPEAMAKADVVITCGQQGTYHKHIAYNVGLLHARGKVVTYCDSDAVFTPDFIASVIDSFELKRPDEPKSLVLMHHEQRALTQAYPEGLSNVGELSQYTWQVLRPNVGACMSVRKMDAIHFGGFDEHPSYRGYYCGPYDLGWRLVNAGIPEIWHDERVALWHFAHPEPNTHFSWKRWREITYPHLEQHALTAVEAFSTGRLLPLKENPDIFKLRMSLRQIGTEYETKYASRTGAAGFSKPARLNLHISLFLEPFRRMYRKSKLVIKGRVDSR